VAVARRAAVLASGGADGVVRAATAGREGAITCAGHAGSVTAVAVHGGGRWVASAGTDGTLRLFDAASGRCAATLFFGQPVLASAWSDDESDRLVVVDRLGRRFEYALAAT
jgi:WD40 repeat protein